MAGFFGDVFRSLSSSLFSACVSRVSLHLTLHGVAMELRRGALDEAEVDEDLEETRGKEEDSR